ncbi:MAG: iron ABC transporter permease [Planctomycetota bacterium]|nr:MAG: iron ABC transporter permease [Planctomycetota bacterium]
MKTAGGGHVAWRFVLALGGLAILLLLSPGIGTETRLVGLADAWRSALGWSMDREALARKPFVDLDGDGVISLEEERRFRDLARHIGFEQRFARSVLALQVGATLALCGAAFQILFRNPLATPYTLGLASGGALGALLAVNLGWSAVWWGISTLSLASFGGAVGVVAAVMLVSRGPRRLTSNELLLAGVTIGLFCSAMMMVVTALSSERVTFTMVRWMMGSLETITAAQAAGLLPLVLPAWVALVVLSGALNQYRLGDELAASRGVEVGRLRFIVLIVATVAVAGVVARCGPIGFVGLVVPHIAYLLFGRDCRIVLPACAVLGGAFLIVCDWASQLAMGIAGTITGREMGSAVLPIGVVTAVVGVPIFLVLLRTRRA